MPKNPLLHIQDILDAIGNIEEDISGYDLARFTSDRRARQLVERNVEIISEASRRIPDSLKQAEPAIEWKGIAGIGNILRHDYGQVLPEVLRGVCQNRLPGLKAAMERMVVVVKSDTESASAS